MIPIRSFPMASAVTAFAAAAFAIGLAPLNSDTKADRMDGSALSEQLSDMPQPAKGTQVGGVSKPLTNEYWHSLGQGHQTVADAQDVTLAYQAAPLEGDQLGQLQIAESMIRQGNKGLPVSPQTDNNQQARGGSRIRARHHGRPRQ